MEEKIQIIKDDEIDLRALAKVIWAGRRFIALITGAFTLIGVVHALLATPYYKSTLTLYPASSDTGTRGQLQGIAATFGMNIGGHETNYNIPDVVKSRRIRKMILEQHWMTEKYNYPVDLITFWEINDTTSISLNPIVWVKNLLAAPTGSEEDIVKEWEEEVLERLGDLISVSEDRKTGLIRIDVLIEEPQLSADVANYIAEAANDYIQAENSFEASRDRNFIEERLTVVKDELNKAENELKEFRQENRRIADSPELQLEQGRLSRKVEVKQQVYITLQQQLELARITEVKQTPVIHILDGASAPLGTEKPRKKLIFFLFTMTGGMVGILVNFTKYIFFNHNPKS
ncbi:MAG: hypothetical protein IIB44_12965 [Candidatus Marinimicrobia bacterium]|nr:hypothetical protein [Candidatus Neomarinimicrobiota bacterium]